MILLILNFFETHQYTWPHFVSCFVKSRVCSYLAKNRLYSFSANIEKKDFRYWSTTDELRLRYAGSCWSIEMVESETNRYYCFKYFEDTGITDLVEAKSFCKMHYNSTLASYTYHVQEFISRWVFRNVPLLSPPYQYFTILMDGAFYKIKAAQFKLEWIASNCDISNTVACHTPVLPKSLEFKSENQIGCGYVSIEENKSTYSSPFMTIQFCVEICLAKSLKVAALRFEDCLCFEDTKYINLVQSLVCDQHCPANEYQLCGSSSLENVFSLYKVLGYSPSSSDYVQVELESNKPTRTTPSTKMLLRLGSATVLKISSRKDLSKAEYNLDLKTGVLTDINSESESQLITYFPDEEKYFTIQLLNELGQCCFQLEGDNEVCVENGLMAKDAIAFIGVIDGTLSIIPYSYEPIANTCKQFYELGMFPNPGECLQFKTKLGTDLTCCWNNIDPQHSNYPCENVQALKWNGQCYIVSPFLNYAKVNNVLTGSQHCASQNASLILINDQNDLDNLSEMLLHHPLSIDFESASFFTSHYVNPLNLYHTIANGRFVNQTILKRKMNTQVSETSCFTISHDKIHEWYSVSHVSCSDETWIICEQNLELQWMPYMKKIDQIEGLFQSIVTVAVHPSTSQSSCLALCSGYSSVKSAILQQSTCICSNQVLDTSNMDGIQCSFFIPCSSSPIQHCGCKKNSLIYSLVIKLSEQNRWPGLNDCEYLKSQGVFVGGIYKSIENEDTFCPGWKSACEPGWTLFDDVCVQPSIDEFEYQDIEDKEFSICPIGSIPYTHQYLGFFVRDHSLMSPHDLWGTFNDELNICEDGLKKEVDCSSKRKFMCSIRICDENEVLFGDQCLHLSQEPGDFIGKTECLTIPSSTFRPSSMLDDIESAYNIGAYFKTNDGEVEIDVDYHLKSNLCFQLSPQDEIIFKECSEIGYYICFSPLKCSSGAIEVEDKCFLLQNMIPKSSAEEQCASQDYHMPTFPHENTELVQLLYKRMKSFGFEFENQLYQFPLGAELGIINKKIYWSSGASNFHSSLFSLEDMIPQECSDDDDCKYFKWQIALHLKPNSHSFVKASSEYQNGPSLCEYPSYTHCLTQEGIVEEMEVDLLKNFQGLNLKPSDCIFHCKYSGHSHTFLWIESNGLIVCSCQNIDHIVDLFSLEQLHRGRCGPFCQDQMCGIDESVLIYPNEFSGIDLNTCDDIYMRHQDLLESTEIFIAENGEVFHCNYNEIDVCQAPLLTNLKPQIFINGEEYDLKYARPLERQWHTNGSKIKDELFISIHFESLVFLKTIFTAYSIEEVKYEFYPNEIISSSFSHINSYSMPNDHVLTMPIVANKFYFKLKKQSAQKSPYFELRGCKVEELTDTEYDDNVYVVKDGIRYESPISFEDSINSFEAANDYCKAKGGTLALPDSKERLEAIRVTIAKHIEKYNYQTLDYLVGISKLDEKWQFVNGLPLGDFMPWEINEPKVGNDCAVVKVLDGSEISTMEMKWSSYDCNSISASRLVCQFNTTKEVNPQKVGCGRRNHPDWSLISEGVESESECSIECKNNNFHWSSLEATDCFCAKIHSGGFLSHEYCEADQNSYHFTPLWSTTCPDLRLSYEVKNLFLRGHFHPHFTSSKTMYECGAGYSMESGVSLK